MSDVTFFLPTKETIVLLLFNGAKFFHSCSRKEHSLYILEQTKIWILDLFMGSPAFWHYSQRRASLASLSGPRVLLLSEKIVLISSQKYAFISQIIVVNQQSSADVRRGVVVVEKNSFCTMIMISFFWQHFPLVSYIWMTFEKCFLNALKPSKTSILVGTQHVY